jgi:hypothetical protein
MPRETAAGIVPAFPNRPGRPRRHVEITIRLVSLRPSAQARAGLRAIAERLVERADLTEWSYREDGEDGLSSSLTFSVSPGDIADFLTRIAPVAARAGAVAVVPTGPWAAPGSAAVRAGLARAG